MIFKNQDKLDAAMEANRKARERLESAVECGSVGERIADVFKKAGAAANKAVDDVANG